METGKLYSLMETRELNRCQLCKWIIVGELNSLMEAGELNRFMETGELHSLMETGELNRCPVM